MQIPRRTMWKHVQIPLRSFLIYWKPCKYVAEPRENTNKYRWWVSRPFGSHANASQSFVKTRANTVQESLDLVEAMRIPHIATWKQVQIQVKNFSTYWKPCKCFAEPRENTCKYWSGVSKLVGSLANTSQSCVKTCANTTQSYLKIHSKFAAHIQILHRASWKHI